VHQRFDALYREQYDSVLGYFLGRTQNRQDAEDLASQVFENAWRGFRRYEDRGNKLTHWLARISRNVLIDHWRQRRPPCEDVDAVPLVDERLDVHGHVHLRLLRRHLARAFLRLTPLQRDVVVCRWLHELSINETAELMGITSLAVRAAQQRAFANLRRAVAV
jgi:RNA polymerase sigma-70 factor (ECF subfamily)